MAAITTASRKYTDNLRKMRRYLQGRGVNIRETIVAGVSDVFPYGDVRIVVPGLHADDVIVSVLNMTDLVDATGYLDATVAQGPAAATLTTNLAGDLNDVRYDARERGADGNNITVDYDLGGALGVAVTGSAIVVTVVTLVTTARQVIDAVNAKAAASALVLASVPPGQDGTGVVVATGALSLAGGLDPGIELNVDSANKKLKVLWVTRDQLDEN